MPIRKDLLPLPVPKVPMFKLRCLKTFRHNGRVVMFAGADYWAEDTATIRRAIHQGFAALGWHHANS